MSIKFSNRAFWPLGILAVMLVLAAGCKHNSMRSEGAALLPGVGQPVRVSTGDEDAAEPAIIFYRAIGEGIVTSSCEVSKRI
jgi:hypothetical protein